EIAKQHPDDREQAVARVPDVAHINRHGHQRDHKWNNSAEQVDGKIYLERAAIHDPAFSFWIRCQLSILTYEASILARHLVMRFSTLPVRTLDETGRSLDCERLLLAVVEPI